MKILIKRFFQNKYKTLSNCELIAENGRILMEFKGIELPDRSNKRNVSCIPAGSYSTIAVRRYSNQKYALWIQDVPGRSQIMIHTANYVRQLLGCLAPGRNFRDIDNDGIMDVESSGDVMRELQKHIPLGTEIIVEIEYTEKPRRMLERLTNMLLSIKIPNLIRYL